jgi:hypothetical protein
MKTKMFMVLGWLLISGVTAFSQQTVTVGINPASCIYTSISDVNQFSVLICTIIPNPNNGAFTMSFNKSVNTETLHLKIFNVFGQMVYSSDNIYSSENIVIVDAAGLSSGTYIVCVGNADFNQQEKFIKF